MGKVLKMKPASVDTAYMISCLHLRLQLKSLYGILKLFSLQNGLLYLGMVFGAGGFYRWLVGFSDIFKDWFGPDGSKDITEFYAAVFAPMGVILAPLSGILLDMIGLRIFSV